jgi:hypothetical protein
MNLQGFPTISAINSNNTIVTSTTDSQQQPTQRYIEANSNNFSEPSTANNSRGIYAITANNNSQNTNNDKLLPIYGSEEPFPDSYGWTFELLIAHMRYTHLTYDQDIFTHDFYQVSFAPYFRFSDACIDWLQDAFNPDKKYGHNNGFLAIYKFITSKKLQDYYNGYPTSIPSSRGSGFAGYIKNLLQKNPISNGNLRKLEAEFERSGRILEVDTDRNWYRISEERKEFYCSHTSTKERILASNIFKHFKNNPHILQNNPKLNEVIQAFITTYGVNAIGSNFFDFITLSIKEYHINTTSPCYELSSLEKECLNLSCYIEKTLCAIFMLFKFPMIFYSIAKKVNNTDISD